MRRSKRVASSRPSTESRRARTRPKLEKSDTYENLLLALPFILYFLEHGSRSVLPLVSKGVLDVMRERPDSERALNLELWMSYAHALGKVRKYAFCVDVEYVLRTAVFFNKIYESKGIRPLWLIGGLHCTGSRSLKRVHAAKEVLARSLTSLTLEHTKVTKTHLASLPAKLKTLKLSKCSIKLEDVEPLRETQVNHLRLESCSCRVGDQRKVISHVALLYASTLRTLCFDNSGSRRERVRASHLSKLTALESLRLISVVWEECAKDKRKPESIRLELPWLKDVHLEVKRDVDVNILQDCKNLEDVWLRYCPENTRNSAAAGLPITQKSRSWYLSDLPKLKEINLRSWPTTASRQGRMHKFDFLKLKCQRDQSGKAVSVEVQSLPFRGAKVDVNLLRQNHNFSSSVCSRVQVVYKDGLLRENVVIRCSSAKSVLLESATTSDLSILLNEAPFVAVGSNRIAIPPRKLKPKHDHYDCTELNLDSWPKKGSKPLASILSRLRLRSLRLRESRNGDWNSSNDFSWLQPSVATLSTLNIESWNPRKHPQLCTIERVGVQSFTALHTLNLTYLHFRPCHILGLGKLPKLSALALAKCTMLLSSAAAKPKPSAVSDLFPSLTSLGLTDCNTKGSADCKSFKKLLRAKKLDSLNLITVFKFRKKKSFLPVRTPSLLRGIELATCVNLDVSGCDQITELRIINAPKLEKLMMNNCEEITSLEGIARFPNLKLLSANYCNKLVHTTQLGSLRQLEVVFLEECTALRPRSLRFLGHSESLMFISLVGCEPSLATTAAQNVVHNERLTIVQAPKIPGVKRHKRFPAAMMLCVEDEDDPKHVHIEAVEPCPILCSTFSLTENRYFAAITEDYI